MPYFYQWVGPNSFSAISQNLSGLSAGTYTLTITDAYGCQSVQSAVINEPGCSVVTTATIVQPACFGGSGNVVWLNSGGGGSYLSTITNLYTNVSIYGPVFGSSGLFSLTPGSYSLSVTDQYGCAHLVNIQIIAPIALSYTITTNAVSCFSGSDGAVNITPVGGTSPYSINIPNPSSTLTAGIYLFTLTDGNSCSIPGSFSITQPLAITTTISSTNVSCTNGTNGTATVNINGGTAPYTYLWSPSASGQTTQTATGLSAGSHSVTIIDANGCTKQDSVLITQPSPLTATTAKTNVSCFNSNNGTAIATPSGGTAPYTYLWSNGQTTPAVINLSVGTYNCTVYDAKGCSFTTPPVTIIQPLEILANISVTDVSCFGASNGSAIVNPLPSGSYSVLWSTGSNAFSVTGLVAGSGYWVTVTNNTNGCTTGLNFFNVAEPSALTATTTQTNVSCFGGSNGSATATVTPTTGTAPYTYQWFLNAGATIPLVPVQTSAIATGLSAGTYARKITDANGCTLITSLVTITQPSALTATIAQTNVSCIGGNNGSATVNPSGGTAPYNYLWSNGQTTQTATGLSAAGTYSCLVTDLNGCTILTLVVITQPSPLTATTSQTNVSCFNSCDGSATASVTAGTGTAPYTYLWSNSQITPTISGLCAGTYTCSITDANGCPTFTTSLVTITQPLEILANISVTNVSCNGLSNGGACVSPSGGSGPYSVQWFTGSNAFCVTGLATNSGYWVEVTDNSGCTTGQNFFNVSQPNALTATATVLSNFNGFGVSCFGGNNGSATATPSGGTASYTYSWNTTPVQTTQIATGLSAGTYTCTITDANLCTPVTTIPVIITQPPALTAPPITTTPVHCLGGSNGTATATPSGGTPFSGPNPYTYLWTPSAQTTQTATGLSVGAYTCTITDTNLCQTTTSVTVTQILPTLSTTLALYDYNGYDVSCYGANDAQITVTAIGGTAPYEYSSFAPALNIWQTDSIFSNQFAGVFTAYVKDANGCIVSYSELIDEPNPLNPVINLDNPLTCSGLNDGALIAQTSGGTTNIYSYSWNTTPVQNTQTATSLAAGFYEVTVTDANNCMASDTFTLGPQFVLVANPTTTSISCTGSSDGSATVAPSGGLLPYTYLWIPGGQITPGLTNLSAGPYTCTITDANGCQIIATIPITESATSLSISNIATTNVSCFGFNNGSATATVNTGSGSAPYTYLWSNGQTTQTATGLVAGTFIVSVNDNSNCTVHDTIIITEPAQLLNTVNQSNISCFGANDGELVNTTSGGTLPYTVNWNGPNSYTSNLDSIGGLDSGQYIITIIDINLCSISDTFAITEPFPLNFVFSTTNPLCYNDANGIINLEINGGTLPYNALYGSGVNSSPTTDSIIITGLSAGNGIVYVSDANGCTDSSVINLTQPIELVIVNVTQVNPTCYEGSNGSAIITVNGGIFPYTFEDIGGNPIDLTALAAGVQMVVVSDANGCLVSTQLNITNPNEIEIDQLPSCYGSLLVDVINTNGNYQIFWDNAPDTVYIDGLSSGTYNATVIDDLGCSRTDSFMINDPFNYIISDASCQSEDDGSIEIYNINGGNGFSPYSVYVNGELVAEDVINSILISDLLATNYQIEIIDNNECQIVNSLLVVGYIGGYNCIDVPIVVSPNSDGTNDTWKPILDIDTDIEVIILNRWGITEFYYSGNSLGFEWDALATNGNNLPTADYYYIIKFNNTNYPDKTGVITLIR